MSESTANPTLAPKHRWQRFSLRKLFVMVTVICGLTAWSIHNWRQAHERETLLRAFTARGAALGPSFYPGEPIVYKETGNSVPLMWRLFGAEEPGGDIWLPPDKFTADERSHLQSLFPDVYVVWWDDKNERLLEAEDPSGVFPAMWQCPKCGYVWDGGKFASRSEAVESANQQAASHYADRHPGTPPYRLFLKPAP
jgi:hypothetical protein